MKNIWKWVGIAFGALVGLIVIAFVIIYFKSQARLTRVTHLPEEMVVIPTDSAALERGEHIFRFRGCEACHSGGGSLNVADDTHLVLPSQDLPSMEGNIYLDDPAIGKVIASDLT
jgi:hypothetical protein